MNICSVPTTEDDLNPIENDTGIYDDNIDDTVLLNILELGEMVKSMSILRDHVEVESAVRAMLDARLYNKVNISDHNNTNNLMLYVVMHGTTLLWLARPLKKMRKGLKKLSCLLKFFIQCCWRRDVAVGSGMSGR